MGETNKETMRRIVDEILNGGDLDAINELVHVDYVDGYADVRGRDGYREIVMAVRRAFPDFQLTIEDTVSEGEKVVGRFTFRGTHQGDFMGIPPTGKQVEFPAMGLLHFKDGQMIRRWNISDPQDAIEQLRS